MRKEERLAKNWYFHLGDDPAVEPMIKDPMYMGAKTVRKVYGFANPGYGWPQNRNDRWDAVTVPHDFIISQTPDQTQNETLGFVHYDVGWYRKTMTFSEEDQNKRVVLYFEGIATESTVYFNGCLMHRNFSAYSSFEVDITDYIDFDAASNLLAIRVNSNVHEGWWYTGGGIVRDVWLVKTEKTSIDRDGVYVHPVKLNGSIWRVDVETTLRNDDSGEDTVELVSRILRNREVLADISSDELILGFETATDAQAMELENPALWDTEQPNLYTMETVLTRNGEEIDCIHTQFGFREAEFRPDGFYLNGKRTLIKGACCHEDYAITGRVMPDTVKQLRLEKLRDIGCNGYRCSHYQQSSKTMDYLDEQGFLVLAELRWFESTPGNLEAAKQQIKRDRNHPSVILWSIGNEEPYFALDMGRRIAEKLIHLVRSLDDRPVTCANDRKPHLAPVMGLVDVMGVNYNFDFLEQTHLTHPEKPFVMSECVASAQSRGWYDSNDLTAGYFNGYDNQAYGFGQSVEMMWNYILEHPWLSGGWQWAGFEHRGETIWPRLCSQSGIFDFFLQPKDMSKYNSTFWNNEKQVHLVPHWNFRGLEGEEKRVCIYTNCEEAELFLNGRSLDRQKAEKIGALNWSVPFEPGILLAVGYSDGTKVAEDHVETTGQAVRLRLRLENRHELFANGRDVAVVTGWCEDEQGRMVPDACPTVRFSGTGKAVILGTGSDVCDHVPVTSRERRMRMGLVSCAVLAPEAGETYRLHAFADGLQQTYLQLLFKK